jgi:hypothetical protein
MGITDATYSLKVAENPLLLLLEAVEGGEIQRALQAD